jgi:very-short-patch-repair endonuclease
VVREVECLNGVRKGRGVMVARYRNGRDKSGKCARNTSNYNSLPFNPALKEFAKELRKSKNLPEVLLWKKLKNGQFKGFDFDRQKIIGNFIVDFFCANCGVVIEIDGSSHDDKVEYDAERDAYLRTLDLEIIHIPANDVMLRLGEVMSMLESHLAFQVLH